MEENSLKAHLIKLKENLAPMSWPQRIDHLWTYYKWVLAIAIGVAVLLNIVITAVISANTEVLLSGMAINASVDDAGYDLLTDGYLARLDGTKRQAVQFSQDILDPEGLALGSEMTYTSIVKVSGMSSTGDLDYLILDQVALEYYATGELFLDLRQIFAAEALAQMPICHVGEVPLIIDITDTWFARNHISGEGPYYLVFIRTGTRTSQCHDLWYYLESGN